MRNILILFTILFSTSCLSAQSYELSPRLSYYTHETEACFIIFGMPLEGIRDIYVMENQALKKLDLTRVNRSCGTFCIDIQSKNPGTHRLRVTISLQWGKNLDLSTDYEVLASRQNEVKIDRLTGGLFVDGLPFYPFGFYTGLPVGDLPVQEVYNAMNLIGVYQSNEDETLAQRMAYMDQCAAIGMKVNYAVNGLVGLPHDKTDFVLSEDELERRNLLLRKEIEAFKDHPALLSWYMNDEPVGQGRPPGILEEAYQMIKKIDPYHPVTVVFVIPDRAKAFEHSMDIAMTDPYPIPGNVNDVRGHMQSLRKHFQYKKGLWMVPQAFGGSESWSREPTGQEMRIMTYLGLYEGAMGIKYFIRRIPNLFPKSKLAWNEATRIAHEVSMLYPWLFNEKGMSRFDLKNEQLLGGVWEHNQQKLVMILNTKNEPCAVDFNLTGIELKENRGVEVLFENRKIEAHGNTIQDLIGGFEVKFYLIDQREPNESPFARHNLFVNPGLERWVSPGVPLGCSARSSLNPNYDGTTFFLDSKNPYAGNSALRINSVHDSSNLSLSFNKMLVEQGRLYSCSFWSNAARHSTQVPFKISIPQIKFEQIFVAGQEWQKHDFQFVLDTNLNAVQLVLETAGKGMFWVDDIAVFPEPVIDVAILEDARARVSLQILDSEKRLKYTVNGGMEKTYTGSFFLDEYSDLDISVSDQSGQSLSMQYSIPLSKATLKKCTFTTTYDEKYKGVGEQTLVDGKYGSLSFKDGQWLGFVGKDVSFQIDLGKEMPIEEVSAHFLVSVHDGIHAPMQLEVNTAREDGDFELFNKVKNAQGSQLGEPYFQELEVSGEALARYVQFRIKSQITIPKGYLFTGTSAWIFIDEVMVR
jgi:hypothetical protein